MFVLLARRFKSKFLLPTWVLGCLLTSIPPQWSSASQSSAATSPSKSSNQSSDDSTSPSSTPISILLAALSQSFNLTDVTTLHAASTLNLNHVLPTLSSTTQLSSPTAKAAISPPARLLQTPYLHRHHLNHHRPNIALSSNLASTSQFHVVLFNPRLSNLLNSAFAPFLVHQLQYQLTRLSRKQVHNTSATCALYPYIPDNSLNIVAENVARNNKLYTNKSVLVLFATRSSILDQIRSHIPSQSTNKIH